LECVADKVTNQVGLAMQPYSPAARRAGSIPASGTILKSLILKVKLKILLFNVPSSGLIAAQYGADTTFNSEATPL